MISCLPITDKKFTEIKEHELKDELVRKWKMELEGGRRRNKSMAHGDLSTHNGVLLKGNRVVIPESLRKRILAQLHESHQGIHKCREPEFPSGGL